MKTLNSPPRTGASRSKKGAPAKAGVRKSVKSSVRSIKKNSASVTSPDLGKIEIAVISDDWFGAPQSALQPNEFVDALEVSNLVHENVSVLSPTRSFFFNEDASPFAIEANDSAHGYLAMAQQSEIILIEPQRGINELFDIYISPADEGQKFFVPSASHLQILLDAARERGLDIASRIIAFKSIDTDNDAFLYTSAKRLSRILVDSIKSSANRIAGDEYTLFPRSIEHALEVALMDRIVGAIRGYVQFQHICSEAKNSFVRIIARPYSNLDGLNSFLHFSGITHSEILTRHLRPLEFAKPDPNRQRFTNVTFTVAPNFDFDAVKKRFKKGSAIFSTNLGANQFGNTILPVLQNFGIEGNDYVVFSNHILNSTIDMQDNAAALAKASFFKLSAGKNVSISALHPLAAQILEDSFRRFRLGMAQSDRRIAAIAPFILDYFERAIAPQIYVMNEMCAGMRNIVRQSSCVAVLPGRYVECNILTGLAREYGIPSVEIQSGPISPTPRFVSPMADEVLCIDPFSFRVYSEFLQHDPDKVHIVGSPKLEQDLRDYRGISKEQARRSVSELAAVREKTIVLLAGQPVGVDTMTAIVDEAIATCKKISGSYLFIKQHPNETDVYAEAYAALAKRRHFQRLIMSKTAQIQMSILASDVVLTYFSTVGLEAFALGRPVICVNIAEGRPPFDLVEIGVAQEAKSAADIYRLLMNVKVGQITFNSSLEFLRDGRASERCAKHIRKLMKSKKRK